MEKKYTMTIENPFYTDLKTVKELLYGNCGSGFADLKLNAESIGYGACSFVLHGQDG